MGVCGWLSMPFLSSFQRCNNHIVTYMINHSVSEFTAFKYSVYCIHLSTTVSQNHLYVKNQNTEIYNLEIPENDPILYLIPL